MSGTEGDWLIGWGQVRVGGLSAPPLAALETGASFAWSGPVVPLRECAGLGSAVRGLARASLPLLRPQSGCVFADVAPGREVELALGPARYGAALVEVPTVSRPFLLFKGRPPPSGTMLTVSRGLFAPPRRQRHLGENAGVICFTPGTLIDTPHGPRRAGDLREGDMVLTADNGPEQVIWIGRRRFGAADLALQPEHRPVRLAAAGDILVSPRHRIAVRTDAVRVLFGEPEILVAAEDLIDGTRIVRDPGDGGASYVHLMLGRHHVLRAGGVECESFHPGTTDLGTLAPGDRARLEDIAPVAALEARGSWAPARRCLDRTEAALLRGATRH